MIHVFGPALGSYVISSVRLSVCPSVCQWQKFSYFLSLVFLDFLHQVSLLWMEKSDEARFSKKKCGGPNLGKKGPKWAKNEVFCLSLDKKSLEFASIAYGNRERWYLAGGRMVKCCSFVWGIICQKGTTKCGAVAQFFTSDNLSTLPPFLSLNVSSYN